MRPTSHALLLTAALACGCGGNSAAPKHTAETPAEAAGEHSGGGAEAAGEHGSGEPGEGEHGGGGEGPGEHADEHPPLDSAHDAEHDQGGEGGGLAPLTGEPALAALRANAAATAARAEHTDDVVEVTHILIAFKGAMRSQATISREEAEQLAADLLARVQAGEDFEAVRKPNTNDPGLPSYKMALGQAPNAYARGQMAPAFGDVGWRLQVGEIGVAPYDKTASPFGWHIIKRIK